MSAAVANCPGGGAAAAGNRPGAGAGAAAISVCNLRCEIAGKTILNGADLELLPGRLYGLIGRNGSGKSTLFRAILGYVKSTGSVQICGRDARRLSTKALARLVAYVPQNDEICFDFSALQIVQMGALASSTCEATAAAALERVGAAALAEQAYPSLSGGERQLVLLARAIAMQTPIMVLDESTSALDLSHQLAVWRLLGELAREGKTVLICTHEPNYAMWFCDEFAIVQDASVLQRAALDDELVKRIWGEEFALRRVVSAASAAVICPDIERL